MTVPPRAGEALAARASVRTTPRVEESDALVVGGNLAGLFVAHVLAQLGYRTKLVEKSPVLGGLDSSFRNGHGRIFDHGLHVLDDGRSELVTRVFRRVIGGRVRRLVRRRGIVLRDHVFAYDAPASEWPAELAALLPQGEIVDRLGDDPPTRENLARYYGRAFADFVHDEVLGSYPPELRHRDFGVEDHELLTNVYPWFFPRATRPEVGASPSRTYHERVRAEPEEHMLYPERGGFGGFAAAFADELEDAGVEVLCGLDDLTWDVDRAGASVRFLETGGRRLAAPRVYWCAPVTPLCGLLGRPIADVKPDWFLLGSFQLREPVDCEFTELIVGAREHPIGRISFPGKLSGERDDLVQVEHAVPRAGDRWPLDAAHWRATWLASLRRLGIVGPGNDVLDFDFKRFPTLYNCYGVEGVRMPEVSLELPPESNLRPVLPSIRSINLSTRIPQFLRFLAEDLAKDVLR